MNNKKEFSIDGVIATLNDINEDQLMDEIIEFVTSKGYTFVGKIEKIEYEYPEPKEPNASWLEPGE